MIAELSRAPHVLASGLAQELSRRASSLDTTDLEHVVVALSLAARTSMYSTRAKHLLTQPLRDRKIPFDPLDWRACGVQLYALWQRMRPADVEKRMAELREEFKNAWDETFPDDHNIDPTKLREFYCRGPALLVNGLHDWNEVSLALRFYVTEQLATVVSGTGSFFDWGGSEGISCLFARHHGAGEVHLFEPNPNGQTFGQWLAPALHLDRVHFHAYDPPMPPSGKRFEAGMCTEVLEHVVDPPGMMRQFHELLKPGGVIFVTSSFAVPQKTHLKSNLRYAGKEKEMMREAGFREWAPPKPAPMPFLPSWGFWQKAA